MTGIYKITNPKGKVYIGESIDIVSRWNHYKNGYSNKQWKLMRSINKYGWEAHITEVLEECEQSMLKERERHWQLYYNSVQNGLNLKLTGVGEIKTTDSPEVSKNRSGGQRGRKHSEETKKKLSTLRKGKSKPEGFSEQIRARKLGVKLSEQHKANIGRSHKKPCVIDGITYSSCKEAAATLNIPERTLHNRLISRNYPNCWFV